MSEYQLRAECRGHEDDVRGARQAPIPLAGLTLDRPSDLARAMTRERRSSLARVPASEFDVHPSPRLLVAFPSSRPAAVVCGADVFATCSRDKTVRVWREAIGDDGYASGTVCVGHSSFVTTLAYAPPGAIPSLPAGALVSGSRDKRVIVWDPNTGALVAEFAGHDLDVTAVAVLASGAVVSGAMDKRVKIWSLDTRACVRTLEAHESSVLALLPLPSGGFSPAPPTTPFAAGRATARLANPWLSSADTRTRFAASPPRPGSGSSPRRTTAPHGSGRTAARLPPCSWDTPRWCTPWRPPRTDAS